MIEKCLTHMFPEIDSRHDGTYDIFLDSRSPSIGRIWCVAHGKWTQNTSHFCQAIGMSDEETVIWILKFGESLPYRVVDP